MKKMILGALAFCLSMVAHAGEISVTGRVLFSIKGPDMSTLGLQSVTYSNFQNTELQTARFIISLNNDERDLNTNYLGQFSQDDEILKKFISTTTSEQVVQLKLSCETPASVKAFTALPEGKDQAVLTIAEVGISRLNKCKLLSSSSLKENPKYIWLAPKVVEYERCGLFRGGLSEGTNMIASPNPQTSVENTDKACSAYCDASGTKPGDVCLRGKRAIKLY